MRTASDIIKALGGPSKLSRELGVHRTRVSNWGSGGVIPQAHHRALLRLAAEKDFPLSAEDLLPPERERAA